MVLKQIRWWFLLPVLALLIGVGLTTRAAFAGTGVSSPAASPPGQPAPARPLTNYMSTDVPKTLPVTGTVTSTLLVPDVSVITSIDVVGVVISHTYPGDLNVYLISPLGTQVQLLGGTCGGVDWNAGNTGFTLSDGAVANIGDTCPPGNTSYKPVSPLAAFAGQPAAGIWTLKIVDNTDEDGGQLNAWGLAIPGSAPQATATPIVVPTNPPAATATPCPISFTDVPTGVYFYQPVQYLYCKGAISGYADNTFRPYANTTRGQVAKIAVLGLNVPLLPPPATPSFSDIGPGNAFYQYVEVAKAYGLVSGYADGTFRPFANVTRGQLTKMMVKAAGHDLITPATQTFTDVPPSDPFYSVIETAACYGIVSGYADNTFREGNDATRSQIAKIAFVADTSNTPCAAVPTPLPQPAP